MPTTAAAVSADRDLGTLPEDYESLPGLRFTFLQVARLLDVDRTCAAHLLEQLEADGLLRLTAGGMYRRTAPLLS